MLNSYLLSLGLIFISANLLILWLRERTKRKHLKKCFRNQNKTQEGEDIILARLMDFDKRKSKGFYVDVGAHHPERFSNTKFFYDHGWSGINIDANPGSMELFQKKRPRDQNIEVAINNTSTTLTFYKFKEGALNTFDPELAAKYQSEGYFLEEKIRLPGRTLASVLDSALPKNQKIDFLDIDVEGFDVQVLKSNNWSKYRPTFVLVESHNNLSVEQALQSEASKFLYKQNYIMVSKLQSSLIFKSN